MKYKKNWVNFIFILRKLINYIITEIIIVIIDRVPLEPNNQYKEIEILIIIIN